MSTPGYRQHRPGVYRRRIVIHGGPGWVHADLEDDPHRYGVRLRHDGTRVTTIEALSLRTPWTLCRIAAEQIQALAGMRLSPDPTAVFRHADPGQQCTHVFDTAGLAIAHAARGTRWRDYRIDAPWWRAEGPRDITLRRDGKKILEWQIDDGQIIAPADCAGTPWRRMLDWARARKLDVDAFEAVVILRRAVMISGARTVSLDPLDNAAETGHVSGACYVFHPGRAEIAYRERGSTRDFTDQPHGLIPELQPPTR